MSTSSRLVLQGGGKKNRSSTCTVLVAAANKSGQGTAAARTRSDPRVLQSEWSIREPAVLGTPSAACILVPRGQRVDTSRLHRLDRGLLLPSVSLGLVVM